MQAYEVKVGLGDDEERLYVVEAQDAKRANEIALEHAHGLVWAEVTGALGEYDPFDYSDVLRDS